jgi:hypothetical protein
MKIVRQLIGVEFAALAALFAVSAAMAAYGAIDSTLHTNSLLGPASSAQTVFGYTAILGLVPALLFGAPSHLILVRRNLARWPYILLLGAAPGLLALKFDITLGFFAIICGVSVAVLTHFVCRRLGPNNSFKPTPHRDVGHVPALR